MSEHKQIKTSNTKSIIPGQFRNNSRTLPLVKMYYVSHPLQLDISLGKFPSMRCYTKFIPPLNSVCIQCNDFAQNNVFTLCLLTILRMSFKAVVEDLCSSRQPQPLTCSYSRIGLLTFSALLWVKLHHRICVPARAHQPVSVTLHLYEARGDPKSKMHKMYDVFKSQKPQNVMEPSDINFVESNSTVFFSVV